MRATAYGVTSACTAQTASPILNRPLDPDAILVVSGATDAFQPLTFDPRPGHPYGHFVRERLHRAFLETRDAAAWRGGLDHEGMLARAFAHRSRLRAETGFGTPGRRSGPKPTGPRPGASRIARATPVLALYAPEPIVVRKDPLTVAERGLATPETLAILARLYDRCAAVLGELEAAGLPPDMRILDASRALDGGGGLFHDIVHYDFDGRGTVARLLAAHLRPMLAGRDGA